MPWAVLAPTVRQLLPSFLWSVLCATPSSSGVFSGTELISTDFSGKSHLLGSVELPLTARAGTARSVEQLEPSGNSYSVIFKDCPGLLWSPKEGAEGMTLPDSLVRGDICPT